MQRRMPMYLQTGAMYEIMHWYPRLCESRHVNTHCYASGVVVIQIKRLRLERHVLVDALCIVGFRALEYDVVQVESRLPYTVFFL